MLTVYEQIKQTSFTWKENSLKFIKKYIHKERIFFKWNHKI